MKSLSLVMVAALALLATLAYAVAATYLSLFWSVFVPDHEFVGAYTQWTIVPISRSVDTAMAHWHLLAVISLLGNTLWAWRRYAAISRPEALALPLSCHMGWLLCATLLHIGGGLMSVVAVSYSI